MKSKIFLKIGFAMSAVGITFFYYAICHPEMGVPFSLSLESIHVVYKSYLYVNGAMYLIAAALKLIEVISCRKRARKKAQEKASAKSE